MVYSLCAVALMRFSRRPWDWISALGGLAFSIWAVAMSGWTLLGIAIGFFVLTTLIWFAFGIGRSRPVEASA